MEFSKSWFSFCDSGLDWLPAELWLAPGSVAVWLLLTEDAMWVGGWRFRGWTQRERERERTETFLAGLIFLNHCMVIISQPTTQPYPTTNPWRMKSTWELGLKNEYFYFGATCAPYPHLLIPWTPPPPHHPLFPCNTGVGGGRLGVEGDEPRGQYYQ